MKTRLINYSLLVGVTGALTVGAVSCGAPSRTCATDEGRKEYVTAVDNALNSGNCTEAIAIITPAYSDPGCANNDIRLAYAAAHACNANVDFFNLVTQLESGNLSGSGFYETLTSIFPSLVSDTKVTSAQYSFDALMAIKLNSAVVASVDAINSSSLHPGSLLARDRVSDANMDLLFVSMAAIGALQNRYGAPDSNHQQTIKLGKSAGLEGWSTLAEGTVSAPAAALITHDACTYAASLLNFVDTMSVVGTSLSGSAGSSLNTVFTALSAGVNAACSLGCTQCGLSCSTCPTTLRYHNSCLGLTTDVNTCAASGLANLVNVTWSN